MKQIADAGLLIAAADPDDPAHEWAADALRRFCPFYVCEVVLAEAAAVTGCPDKLMAMILRGDLLCDFDLVENADRVAELLAKYRDQPMDLGDACVVRMSELNTSSRVWTVDRKDFSMYRRQGRQQVPCEFPPLRP